jgi:hypothetical protein
MTVKITTVTTIELAEKEAQDICKEVFALDRVIETLSPDDRLRLEMPQVHRLRDYLTDRGLGVRIQSGWAGGSDGPS